MELSSNTSTETSKKTVLSNEIQQSDKPQQQANLTIKSPQKNEHQIEDSKNMEPSCVNTPQQVDTSTVNAPEELEASPLKATMVSEGP